MNKNKQKAKSLIIVITLIVTLIGFFFIYRFNSHKVNQFSANLNFKARIQGYIETGTFNLLIALSQPAQADYFDANEELIIENISKSDIAKYRNSGAVGTNVESLNARVVIEKANIDGKLLEGEDAWTMLDGPWLFPLSVAPGQRGNSVIIGHRFAEIPPSTNTFYNLDKLEIGDKITISQDDGDINYTVISTKVVEKNDRSVLAPTSDYLLTLITCTPLWTSDQRLVVTAKIDRVFRNI